MKHSPVTGLRCLEDSAVWVRGGRLGAALALTSARGNKGIIGRLGGKVWGIAYYGE